MSQQSSLTQSAHSVRQVLTAYTNTWNETNLLACEQAKSLWTQATSRREENVDAYKIDASRDADAFPSPKWPTQTLDELIGATFANRMIETPDHAAFKRLIGAKQDIS
jgi:hypothetical protein